MGVYYWLYPYNNQLLVRDAAYTDLAIGDPGIFKLMKFFPVGFLLAWEEPPAVRLPFGNLAQFQRVGLDQDVEICVKLTGFPHMNWSETPTDNSFILQGAGTMTARERSPH